VPSALLTCRQKHPRAVLMTAAGGPGVLQPAGLAGPQVTGDHDVRVRMRAAGINLAGCKLGSAGTAGGSLPAVVGWDGTGWWTALTRP
jgi:NADPH:quinone reductase-like Zn-dependent oxidoreductase